MPRSDQVRRDGGLTASDADGSGSVDEVLEAIDGLVAALRENSMRAQQAVRRAEKVRTMRKRGLSYREILAEGAALVEITGQNLQNLLEHGSRLRRAQAKALHEEGCTMDEIAVIFSVSRQRVSALLKQAKGSSSGSRARGDS